MKLKFLLIGYNNVNVGEISNQLNVGFMYFSVIVGLVAVIDKFLFPRGAVGAINGGV